MRTAIIGAGIAGLAAATRLQGAGHRVSLFDKGRGAGGRMASRRVGTAGGEASFDHGAQFFRVTDPDFSACVAGWEHAGLASIWPAAGATAFVGTPSMNAPLRAMARNLDVAWRTRVEAAVLHGSNWFLRGDAIGGTPYDAIIIAIPAEQAVMLLAPIIPDFARLADAAISAPCWTVMLAFDAPVSHATDILTHPVEPLGWAARNCPKPGRTGPEAWVVQASPTWSIAHLEDEPGVVVESLQAAFATAIGGALPEVLSATAHRWRYARPASSGLQFLWDGEQRLGVCGDWLSGPCVEAAWLSGYRLAGAMLG